jgi:hypothetical protein
MSMAGGSDWYRREWPFRLLFADGDGASLFLGTLRRLVALSKDGRIVESIYR